MMREGFNSDAIGSAMLSYLDTCRYLQQENAYESHGVTPPPPIDSSEIEDFDGDDEMDQPAQEQDVRHSALRKDQPPTKNESASKGIAERTVFTEEGSPGQYLTLRVAGEVTDTMLEALEDYVKRQRKRLSQIQ